MKNRQSHALLTFFSWIKQFAELNYQALQATLHFTGIFTFTVIFTFTDETVTVMEKVLPSTLAACSRSRSKQIWDQDRVQARVQLENFFYEWN